MVYITTPAIPSCFVAFFSDPYVSYFKFKMFNMSSMYSNCDRILQQVYIHMKTMEC